MNRNRRNPRPTLNFATRFVAFMTALFVVLPAQAQDRKTVDLGVVRDGDVVWVQDDGSVRVDRAPVKASPEVPCEVCVSRAVVLQASQDAREADRLRADLKGALVRLEYARDSLDATERARHAAVRRAEKAEGRPGFWSGAAFGAGGALVAILVLVLVAR